MHEIEISHETLQMKDTFIMILNRELVIKLAKFWDLKVRALKS